MTRFAAKSMIGTALLLLFGMLLTGCGDGGASADAASALETPPTPENDPGQAAAAGQKTP